MPNLKEKEAAGSAAPINPPAVAPKKVAKKVVKKDEAVAAAPVAAAKPAAAAVQPVDEVDTKPVLVPAPVPAKKVWGAVAKPAPAGF